MARSKKNQDPATTREVRDWARDNGFEVGARGKIKAEVVEAYTKATGRPLVSA